MFVLNDERYPSASNASIAPTTSLMIGTKCCVIVLRWDKHKFGSSSDKHLRITGRYLGLVTESDRSIGAILAKLEDLD